MAGDGCTRKPNIIWAQRKDKVIMTIILENCQRPKHELTADTFSFTGIGGNDQQCYEVKLQLNGEIVPEECIHGMTGREICYVLKKKDANSPFWPHLFKGKERLTFVKTDFNKWKDEDDSDVDEKEDYNLDEMMSSMGGLGDGAVSNNAEDETDSDDGDLPDLE